MSTGLAICALGVLSALLLAALVYREHRHDRERADLLDRIASPQAAEAAAMRRLVPNTPVLPETDDEDDARFGVDLTYDDDLELIGLEREL